ncbi:MAG: type VI secretion system Vgr family protein [Phycisphaerales bacterium]
MPVVPVDNRWSLVVKRDGAEWKDFERADVERFEWRGALNEPPTGRLVVLIDSRRDAAPLKLEDCLGKSIDVELLPPGRDTFEGESGDLKFAGEGQSATYLGQSDGRARWEIVFRHKAHRLMQKACCKTWSSGDYDDVKVEDIVRQLLSDAGLSVKKLESSKLKRNAVLQYRETDFNFLLRLVEDMGCWIDFHADTLSDLSITRSSRGAGEKLDSDNTLDWALESAPTPNLLDVIAHPNPKKFRVGAIKETAKADKAPSKKAFGEMKVVDFDTAISSEDVAKVAAEALVRSMTSPSLRVRATANGSCYLPGQEVELDNEFLDGVTSLETTFLVTASEVSFTPEGVTSTFSGHLRGEDYLPHRRAIRPRIDGVLPAIVVTSDSDVDEHGRIRVKFPWADDDMSAWVRVAQPWAGKDRGVQFLPHVDDEVLVAFEHGDPSQPIIIGSLHNSENTIPTSLSSEWTKSIVKTKAEHLLTFEDKGGEEFVEVLTGINGHKIRLDDKDQFIEVTSGGGHTLTLDDMGKKVELKSAGGAELTMDDNSQTVTIKVGGCSIEMAPAGITIKATQVTVKGDAKVAVEGAMTEVKGSGMLKLQGGMTMIN